MTKHASCKLSTLATLLVVLAAWCGTMSGAWADALYPVTDLGPVGSSTFYPYAINSWEQIVGYAGGAHSKGAYLWEDGSITGLGNLGGYDDRAYGINSSGQAVGKAKNGDGNYRAFLWEDGEGMQDIGTLGGDDAAALAINDAGRIVGDSYITGNTYWHACLWEGTTKKDLGTLAGGNTSTAFGVNQAGQIVGESKYAGGGDYSRAFLWEDDTMTDLGTLGGTVSRAYEINAHQQVVGYSSVGTGALHAFLWDAGEMTDLGTLGGTTSIAFSINDAGQVVGYSYKAVGAAAFIWDSTNGMRELNDLIPEDSGWTLNNARAISESGYIVGWGWSGGGSEDHGFLATPEPGTTALVLLGLGLSALAAKLRRHR